MQLDRVSAGSHLDQVALAKLRKFCSGGVTAYGKLKPAISRVKVTEVRLVLLSYKLRRPRCTAAPPRHGQRGKRVTIAAMSLRRMVAIEFGMCRSGRKGGSSGSVTVGYGKLREQSGGTRS